MQQIKNYGRRPKVIAMNRKKIKKIKNTLLVQYHSGIGQKKIKRLSSSARKNQKQEGREDFAAERRRGSTRVIFNFGLIKNIVFNTR